MLSSAEMTLLSSAVDEISYPTFLSRKPRLLCYYKDYKVSELLHVLLYDLPFVFKRRDEHIRALLSPKIKRWVLGLSTAMHLLLADECSQPKDAEIALPAEQAELLIKEFLHLATESWDVIE